MKDYFRHVFFSLFWDGDSLIGMIARKKVTLVYEGYVLWNVFLLQ